MTHDNQTGARICDTLMQRKDLTDAEKAWVEEIQCRVLADPEDYRPSATEISALMVLWRRAEAQRAELASQIFRATLAQRPALEKRKL